MVSADDKGSTCKEVGTLSENRRAGKSFLDNTHLKAVARSFVDVGRALVEDRLKPQLPSTLRTFLDRERPLARGAPESVWWSVEWAGVPVPVWWASTVNADEVPCTRTELE